MAVTISDVLNVSNVRAESALSTTYDFVQALGSIVSSNAYMNPPESIRFDVNTAQYAQNMVIPTLAYINSLPSLVSRQTTLDNQAGMVNEFKDGSTSSDPGTFDQSVWDIPALPGDFTQQPEALVLPEEPEFSRPNPPAAAATTPVRLNLTASGTVQTAAGVSYSDIPTPDTINVPTFDLPYPVVDWSVPSNNFSFVEQEYSSDLRTAIQNALTSDILYGGYGIDPATETAMVSRAKDRAEAAYRTAAADIARNYAARGFPLPGTDMATLTMMARDRLAGELADINRDVYIKRSDLYVQARQFALSSGVQWEQALLNYHGNKMERALNTGRYAAEFALRFNEALGEYFKLRLELWGRVSDVQTQWVDNAFKGLQNFEAQLKRLDMEDQRNRTKLEAMQAANAAVAAIEGIRQTQLEIAKTEVEINKLELAKAGQLTEQYLAQHQGNEIAFKAYETMVNAKVARNKPIEIALDIYSKRLDAAKVRGEVYKDQYSARLEGHRENLHRHQHKQQSHLAALGHSLDRVKMLAEGGNQDILALQSMLLQQVEHNNRLGLEASKVRIDEFQSRWRLYVDHLNTVFRAHLDEDRASTEAAAVATRALETVLNAAQQMIVGIINATDDA